MEIYYIRQLIPLKKHDIMPSNEWCMKTDIHKYDLHK